MSNDTLDLRDLAEELAELKQLEARPHGEGLGLTIEDEERLTALRELEESLGDLTDWVNDHDATLVADHYFEDYARELAEELALIPDQPQWPCCCIDWELAAEELQADY